MYKQKMYTQKANKHKIKHFKTQPKLICAQQTKLESQNKHKQTKYKAKINTNKQNIWPK